MKLKVSNSVASIIEEDIDDEEINYSTGNSFEGSENHWFEAACISLPIDSYDDLYTAICEDNFSAVEKRINAESDHILNGEFIYAPEPALLVESRDDGRPQFQVTRPWCLAGAYSSKQCMRVMYDHNIDVCAKDVNGKIL